ncbi:acetyl/propionyl/methylcrotonyl-CoA carboxylase subunit alpha [Epibacterium ulvae]|uniref:acetyl-CoA carboxylase biotin carboxylase subunit n=1 Tax=Epibacterium ulvae TaxID=1156985 RepID=UPI001BFC5355|nr:acetyl/propionyl/methylcrotonyl-CoA carboxylase subunit alpha [Epibacterium ulvae]MBT8155852.1 acetyl/propionyl/methylcrotonyl-CoA carboxylase subunit alpha [Epibacterium ulvae]
MFDKILIANRGEIACRIMQTAQPMGVTCVAVYSDADKGALHVQMADEAYHIGGAAPADSYLLGERIIGAARASGAQAIHPGYGFLSENPDFVDAVEAAGLVFIGPSATAIRAMGLKDAAKVKMEAAGVLVVPGYHGENQDPDHLAQAAADIGYPVLIKAVAGGGGKGMRLVEDVAAFSDALHSARSEAQTAFGNPAVLIEKFVQQPRHIEVQIFGDGTRAVHLFERDCSLQRRHQKVVEEAPAPGMTDEMRQAMGQAAVRAAESIGYAGAGTVEFIVDASDGLRPDRFWFMEMNTRLQVEHPVTEAITGVDLVAWQLRVAAGEPLPVTQDDLSITGHAFEARIYAEDVPAGFLPATGQLTHVAFAKGARVDSGVRGGDEISPWYDPMIAKLTVHGETRAIALSRMRQALAKTQIAGVTTNLPFLSALCAHPGFAAGQVDTGLIERDRAQLVPEPIITAPQIIAAGQALLGLTNEGHHTGFTLWAPLERRVHLSSGDQEYDAWVSVISPERQIWRVDGAQITVQRSGGQWLANGQPLPDAVKSATQITVFGATVVVFDVTDPLDRHSRAGGDDAVIAAPMPGLVKALFAKPGQAVKEGERLAILEAMKMEHALLAARDGVVKEVLVKAQDQVTVGAPLIQLVAAEETP